MAHFPSPISLQSSLSMTLQTLPHLSTSSSGHTLPCLQEEHRGIDPIVERKRVSSLSLIAELICLERSIGRSWKGVGGCWSAVMTGLSSLVIAILFPVYSSLDLPLSWPAPLITTVTKCLLAPDFSQACCV